MFQLNPFNSYMMPAHFGPRPKSEKSTGWYHDVTMVAIPYLTDAKLLANYLPKPFRVADKPQITVVYAKNRNIDWLAGHGYNLISVNAAVVYDGKEEQLEGYYTMVMWENLADPILTGRELQGIPKIYADIPDHVETDRGWYTSASHFGHKIVDLSIKNMRSPTEQEMTDAALASKGKDHPMAWRFFAGVPGFGQSVNEMVTFPSETIYKEVQVGEGSIDWKNLSWEQNPTQCHIVNALAGLPVEQMLPAMAARGSVNLLLPDNPARVLR